MLTFFTDPYDDEVISSVFARYHLYSGNIDKNDTIEELQGERNITAFRIFPSRLSFLESQLSNKNYTAERFIYNNTIYPVYSVFLSKDKQKTVVDYMKEKGSDKIYLVLGISTSKMDTGKGYKFCPMCVEEDINLYGEAYFHRVHQVQGVLVCEKHECMLLDYVEEYKSEIEYIRLEYKNINLPINPQFYEKDVNDILVQIAKSIKFIMSLEYLKYNKEFIFDKFYTLLDNKGYLTIEGKIKQNKLALDFISFYGNKVLKLLNSEMSTDKGNWLRSMFAKNRHSLQPVRAILLIMFLTNDISEFFYKVDEKKQPFGDGPWPCLNPVCDYYKKYVISNITIEQAHKSRLPNGIFACEYCDYTYRRKGPDTNESDKIRKDKVLTFGNMWEKEFGIAIERKDKKKDIIKRFEVYDKFIDYYKKNNSFITRDYKTNLGNIHDNFDKYTSEINEYMKNNKNCTRSDILKIMSRQVGWLKYNNPKWLEENLPSVQGKKTYNKEKKYDEVDIYILEKVKKMYNDLIIIKKNKRITITLIERLLNEKINRRIEKLPKTKVFLDSILENVDQYSIRRVTTYCDELLKENRYMKDYEIIRCTAISYSLISNECKKKLDIIIDEYYKKYKLANKI